MYHPRYYNVLAFVQECQAVCKPQPAAIWMTPHSTAPDLQQWSAALASGKVVSPASYRQMLIAVQPERSSDINAGYGLYFGQTPYGLMVLSYGGMAGFSSLLVSYPGNGVDIALLSNTANGEADVFELVETLTPLLAP